jgi:hypothetical protein
MIAASSHSELVRTGGEDLFKLGTFNDAMLRSRENGGESWIRCLEKLSEPYRRLNRCEQVKKEIMQQNILELVNAVSSQDASVVKHMLSSRGTWESHGDECHCEAFRM